MKISRNFQENFTQFLKKFHAILKIIVLRYFEKNFSRILIDFPPIF